MDFGRQMEYIFFSLVEVFFFPDCMFGFLFHGKQKFDDIKSNTVFQSFGPTMEMKDIHGNPPNRGGGKCS